ncbi:hypothetical protein BDV96DRAFT_609480 [Lophiotrema nucula]|uniref:FAD-binding PCMH-type domain-containing protein n=1 Tax=Lophiotrema nucula TaxID=690887 RepID=A0A6A5ZT17_9PLEO|nr:hypothetical protein BDV96DRAFT_609480 [Lophiotrema nucula]
MHRMYTVFPALTVLGGLAHAAWYEKGSGILEELGPKLSKDARILLKDHEAFTDASSRWQWWAAPEVSAVVDVYNEDDVSQTILYANKHDIPFIIKGAGEGHGATLGLAKAKNAIQIYTKNLDQFDISPSGTTARIGGGIKAKKLIEYLSAQKKQTVTGACECVALAGVALGGGHGFLQGYYGLLSDQFVSLRIVLANGTAVTASETEHPDLFWAMQGAGHNFGVVVEFEYKIYDVDYENKKEVWSYEVFTYPATKDYTRKVYTAAKKSMKTQPKGMLQYGLVLTPPALGSEPVILHHILWHGPLTEKSKYTQSFHDLEPLNVQNAEGTLLDAPRWMQIDAEGVVCNANKYVPGAGIPRFPVDLKEYNVEAVVDSVDRFSEVMKTVPELSGSFFMIEQYSVQGLALKKSEDSAVPFRDDTLLLAPAFFYSSLVDGKPNTTIDELAFKYGKEIKQILVDGAGGKTHAYVNYAYGHESLEEIYGEPWRLEKLRKLKSIYDPENRFRFYAPIVVSKEKGHDEL